MLINMKRREVIVQSNIHILNKSPLCKIPLLMVMGVFLYIPILKAQNSNFWDLRKERTEPLPYGETIVLKDSFEGPINSVSVTAIYGLNKQTGEVSIDGNTWTALVGPFLLEQMSFLSSIKSGACLIMKSARSMICLLKL